LSRGPIELHQRLEPPPLEELRDSLGIPGIRSARFVESLPFSAGDVTSGSETELQAAVHGDRRSVDLPLAIESSNYFANIAKRANAGDTSERAVSDLEKYLAENESNVWDNSWVRFPLKALTSFARAILARDLLVNRQDPCSASRQDLDKFVFLHEGERWLRVPISYLMKIALADVLGAQEGVPELVRSTGSDVMGRLLSDNTSPETLSFYVVPLRSESGFGKAIARETSKRFLLSQLLILYANCALGLRELGQRAMIYFSPHPPIRQKRLNECISDTFYRELFMNPCLSGWDNGVEKHDYMCLCHQVLSRSQLNAVGKLREAGIITRNLVVLPNVSNISLANNGTHISLGSLKLSSCLADRSSGFGATEEKYLGDLVIKIVEHFLPLFVGTYSAAPYRLDFADFHPERVLGFLPHELDYTHLRMIWRRWKKKASVKILGQPTTPFGLRTIDRALTLLFRVKGDFIPDYRLVDYMVAPMSTAWSPALNGKPGNLERLKKDLADMGVIDARMSLYMIYRLREFHNMGFSGFEGRHYSLFESLDADMAEATNLQVLVTALAFKLALRGSVRHSDIPDDPFVESERRHVFFGSALGIPTFYVHESSGNRFLRGLLRCTKGTRYSRRYPGYLRVYNRQFRLALTQFIRSEGADLIENLGLEETLNDLVRRIDEPHYHAAGERLTTEILKTMGLKSPLQAKAEEFNLAAERYYQDGLKSEHVGEALTHLREDLRQLEVGSTGVDPRYRDAFRYILGDRSPSEYVSELREAVMTETVTTVELYKLIDLLLTSIHYDAARARDQIDGGMDHGGIATPVYRAGNWDNP
jgi:hypothetical protein